MKHSHKFQSNYVSKTPDDHGMVEYSPEENQTWQLLFDRQMDALPNRACKEFIKGLELLHLHSDHIPQCFEVNYVLNQTTGWAIEPVPALISNDHFFELLSHRKFPATTFIRKRSQLTYLTEPDVFHEVFGHCPLLTDPAYADFMQAYGQLGLSATDEQRKHLARLYWYTVEFGLIKTKEGLRAYGGGILSSIKETEYCLSGAPFHKTLNTIEAFRTPYRIDHLQPVYFVIESFEQFYNLLKSNLIHQLDQASELGDFVPLFEPEE